MRRAEEFFKISVTRTHDPETCKGYENGDRTVFSEKAALATLFLWVCIYIAVFRGVKSESWFIWWTVPLPIVFILVMLVHGLTLEGSGNGIKDYLQGREEVKAEISTGKMWADAIG